MNFLVRGLEHVCFNVVAVGDSDFCSGFSGVVWVYIWVSENQNQLLTTKEGVSVP